MLGITLLLDGDEDPAMRSGCSVSVRGLTDNLGNQFAVAELLTTKWPLSAFLAEIAVQLETKNIMLDVAWVPRELNTEADAITNGDVAWLTPALEIKKEMQELPFLVLKELLGPGTEFHKNIDATNLEGEEWRAKSNALLKVRHPWD